MAQVFIARDGETHGKKIDDINDNFTDIYSNDLLVAEIKYFGLRTSSFGGWKLCDGSAVSAPDQAKIAAAGLTTAWNTAYGTNLYPNFDGRVIAQQNGSGSAMGAVTGSSTQTLTEANLPSHNHSATASAVGNHSHSVDPPNTSTSSTTQSISASTDTKGVTDNYVVINNGSATPYRAQGTGGSSGGYCFESQWEEVTLNNVHSHSVTINTSSHSHTVNIGSFTSGGAGGHTPSVSIGDTGSGTAHNNMQPTAFAGNYFIYVG